MARESRLGGFDEIPFSPFRVRGPACYVGLGENCRNSRRLPGRRRLGMRGFSAGSCGPSCKVVARAPTPSQESFVDSFLFFLSIFLRAVGWFVQIFAQENRGLRVVVYSVRTVGSRAGV